MLKLDIACSQYNCEDIINLMKSIIVEYTPSVEIRDTLWFKTEHTQNLSQVNRRTEKVVPLNPK